MVAAFAEMANKLACLVCGDTAAHTDDDAALGAAFPTRLIHHVSYCSEYSNMSWWISRRAVVSGFSCAEGFTSGPTYSRMPSANWL